MISLHGFPSPEAFYAWLCDPRRPPQHDAHVECWEQWLAGRGPREWLAMQDFIINVRTGCEP